MIGARAVVARDVPDHAIIAGVPGKTIGWASESGATLKSEGGLALCSDTGQRYHKGPNGQVVRIG